MWILSTAKNLVGGIWRWFDLGEVVVLVVWVCAGGFDTRVDVYVLGSARVFGSCQMKTS